MLGKASAKVFCACCSGDKGRGGLGGGVSVVSSAKCTAGLAGLDAGAGAVAVSWEAEGEVSSSSWAVVGLSEGCYDGQRGWFQVQVRGALCTFSAPGFSDMAAVDG